MITKIKQSMSSVCLGVMAGLVSLNAHGVTDKQGTITFNGTILRDALPACDVKVTYDNAPSLGRLTIDQLKALSAQGPGGGFLPFGGGIFSSSTLAQLSGIFSGYYGGSAGWAASTVSVACPGTVSPRSMKATFNSGSMTFSGDTLALTNKLSSQNLNAYYRLDTFVFSAYETSQPTSNFFWLSKDNMTTNGSSSRRFSTTVSANQADVALLTLFFGIRHVADYPSPPAEVNYTSLVSLSFEYL